MKSQERRERKPNRERFICKNENLRKDNLRGKVRKRFFLKGRKKGETEGKCKGKKGESK